MPMYDFKCPKGHIFESLQKMDTKEIKCTICGELAQKQISPVRIALDGTDPAFPTAYDKWAKKHEQAARIENKREYDE